jgi:hypothetical protein
VFVSCESKYRALGVAVAAALTTYGHEVAFDADAIARGTPGFSEVSWDGAAGCDCALPNACQLLVCLACRRIPTPSTWTSP